MKMDHQSANLMSIWRDLAKLTHGCVTDIKKCLEENTLKLDVVYNDCLLGAQKDSTLYVSDGKKSKRQSKSKNTQSNDAYPSFQQPAVPPVRKTRMQTSFAASDQVKNVRESATISSGPSTRASRARALSTLMDISQIDCPKANSTFVEIKKCSNIDEILSPQLFSPEEKNETSKKGNQNETYTLTATLNLDDVKQSIEKNKKNDCNMSKKSLRNVKQAESNNFDLTNENKQNGNKRENIDNTDGKEEESLLQMTRTKKRKLEDEKQNLSNVIKIPLEKKVSNFLKPTNVVSKVKGNDAEKRKEMYLKSKADQRKFDELHLKNSKQREKLELEKIKKITEENNKKVEKQKEKELKIKEEALKKQKQREMYLAEKKAKLKQIEEEKLQKQKAELLLKLKENEVKKIKNSNTTQVKTMSSNLSSTSTTTSSKPGVKSKINQVKELATNDDYGLNDISARDSSEDESGPKKPVPDWAKRSNRKTTLELQYLVDTEIRNLFFDCPKQQCSIKDMFQGWKFRDRQRTSSAVWNTPVLSDK